MATPKSKKRRKIIIFTAIGLVLVAMALVAIFRKREPVITVQTEKVARRNLTELVVANGRIQPVLQVKISAEVSGEITELPVKEGQRIKKGDLLVKIRPDTYLADRRSAEATYLSALSSQVLAEANLRKADLEFQRNESLFQHKLISDSDFLTAQTALDIAKAQLESAKHQVDVVKGALAKMDDELAKTTIYSPLTGTVSKLNSELGERVVGTALMTGTEIMTVADLNEMEARVDIGEMDVVLIVPGQKGRLEVDAFKDRKFAGTVSEVANSSKGLGQQASLSSSQSQEATKFEVKIRFDEKETFRPGMSVTAEIETRSRTNALTVPLASVTTRLPKEAEKKDKDKKSSPGSSRSTNSVTSAKTNASPVSAARHTVAVTTNALATATNALASATNAAATATNALASATNVAAANGTNAVASGKKAKEAPKPQEVVFVLEGDRVKMVPVKIGISDDSYWEITDGLKEGQEIVSGGYKAISRDLEDGKRVHKGKVTEEKPKA